MKLKDYMALRSPGDEITCFDNVVDSEFYFYKKEDSEKPDPEFPNWERCLSYLVEHLEVKRIDDEGITVGLYELLENPAVIDFAKKHLYEEDRHDEVEIRLFDDMVTNISNGYEEFSEKMMECFDGLEQSLVAIRDNVKVEWVNLGEGLHGDYNPHDPGDIELLRFDVSVLRNGEWTLKEDGSYCTQFPVNATFEQKMNALEILLERFHSVLSDDINVSIKKLGEKMSGISLADVFVKEMDALLDKYHYSLEDMQRIYERNKAIKKQEAEMEGHAGYFLETMEQAHGFGPYSQEEKEAFECYTKNRPGCIPGEVVFIKEEWEKFQDYFKNEFPKERKPGVDSLIQQAAARSGDKKEHEKSNTVNKEMEK